MKPQSLNNDNSLVIQISDEPDETTMRKVLKEAFTYSGPMIACSIAGLTWDVATSMLINRNLNDSACVAFAFYNGFYEWLLSGVSVGLTTTTAKIAEEGAYCENQSRGNLDCQDWKKIGSHFQHGLRAAVIYSVFFDTFLLLGVPYLSPYFGYKENNLDTVTSYASIYAIGVPAYFFTYCFNEFGYATKNRRPVFAIQFLSGLIGTGVGYALMQSSDGSDDNKLLGMSWGMVTRYWTSCIASALYYRIFQKTQKFGNLPNPVDFELFKYKNFDFAHFRNMLWTGFQTQVFVTVEVAVISVMTALSQRGGPANIKAIQIATQYLSLMIVPLFVIAAAANIMISETLGRDKPEDMPKIGNTLTLIGILTQVMFMGLFTLLPEILIGLFRGPVPEGQTDEVVELSMKAIYAIGAVQWLDAIRLIYGGALRGAKDYAVNCLASLLMLLPITYFLGEELAYGQLGMGLLGILIGRDLALGLNAVVTGGWWGYKSHHPEKGIGTVLKSCGLFRCGRVEADNVYMEETRTLISPANVFQPDPAHAQFYPRIDTQSQFQHPGYQPCLLL